MSPDQALLIAARAGERLDPVDADPAAFTTDAERGSFWVNLYNALVLDAVHREGLSGDLRAHRGLYTRTALMVAGVRCSLHVIEHGLLRANRPAPWTFWRPLRGADPRRGWQLRQLEPRIHFALNCGARSCPPIRAYTAAAWEAQLDLATRSYFASEARCVDDEVSLPWLLRLYARDFPDAREFSARHAEAPVAAALRAGARVRWSPYDWTVGGP